MGILVVGAVLPSVGEVSNAGVKYSGGDVGRDRSIMEDARFQLLVCICAGQGTEGVILVPSHVPVEPLEFCQVFGEVRHLLMGIVEALDFSLQGGVPFAIDGEVDHR